jgi:hypothetical protein
MFPYPAKPWSIDIHRDPSSRDGYGAVMGTGDHTLRVPEPEHYVVNSTNPGGALDNRIEHRLHIRRRATDYPEYFGRCGLMFQRLAEFGVALLDLLDQPDVLDCDDSLIGKGLEQRNLLVRERSHLKTANQNSADRHIFA